MSLIFCQLVQASSLRETSDGLKTCAGKLNHLGVEAVPANPIVRMPINIAIRKSSRRFFRVAEAGSKIQLVSG